jgi:hypothetical protein
VHAARELSVEVTAESPASQAAIGKILHLLADRLCVHAPQEVFANEIAIRAGFGDALFHLDKGAVGKARLGVAKRASLVQSLDKQVGDGKLNAEQVASLLLVGDLQAYLGFALETAPFLSAGRRYQADALEAALREGVWSRVDPAVMPLYEKLRDHFRQLRGDFKPTQVKAWASEATALLAGVLGEKNLHVRFDLAPRRSARERSRERQSESAPVHGGAPEHVRGSP